MVVDKAAALDFVCAWWVATRSPRTLVWLPVRTSTCTCESRRGRRLDLVLEHHSLGFPTSAWTQVRARARSSAAAHTVELPRSPFPTITPADHANAQHHARRRHRPPGPARATTRDTLRFTTAAETLFIVGSRPAFTMASDALRHLVEDCPADMAARPGTHCCAEIGSEDGYWGNDLHIMYCPVHR